MLSGALRKIFSSTCARHFGADFRVPVCVHPWGRGCHNGWTRSAEGVDTAVRGVGRVCPRVGAAKALAETAKMEGRAAKSRLIMKSEAAEGRKFSGKAPCGLGLGPAAGTLENEERLHFSGHFGKGERGAGSGEGGRGIEAREIFRDPRSSLVFYSKYVTGSDEICQFLVARCPDIG